MSAISYTPESNLPTNYFDNFPAECLVHIFEHLNNDVTLSARCEKVCRAWQAVIKEHVWKKIYASHKHWTKIDTQEDFKEKTLCYSGARARFQFLACIQWESVSCLDVQGSFLAVGGIPKQSTNSPNNAVTNADSHSLAAVYHWEEGTCQARLEYTTTLRDIYLVADDMVLVSTAEGCVQGWNWKLQSRLFSITTFSKAKNILCTTAGNQLLISGNFEKSNPSIKCYSLLEEMPYPSLIDIHLSKAYARVTCIAAEKNILICGIFYHQEGNDGYIHYTYGIQMLEITTAKNILNIVAPNLLRSLAYEESQNSLATGGPDGEIHLWNTQKGEAQGRLRGPYEGHRTEASVEPIQRIRYKNNFLLASVAPTLAAPYSHIELWDVRNKTLLAKIESKVSVTLPFDVEGSVIVHPKLDFYKGGNSFYSYTSIALNNVEKILSVQKQDQASSSGSSSSTSAPPTKRQRTEER